eukprot:scaffold22328_cov72-Skeletonema_dohrnii-CCMP3373.AAC.2
MRQGYDIVAAFFMWSLARLWPLARSSKKIKDPTAPSCNWDSLDATGESVYFRCGVLVSYLLLFRTFDSQQQRYI